MLKEMSALQFGEFTLDRYTRELRSRETVLPVSGKAFDLLCYMAANPGRPLPKSELLDAVWPETSVEESNLSQNVFLLRKVLGSDGPIKTLPGRGYQFAAQVKEIQASSGSQAYSTRLPEVAPSVSMQTTHTRVVVEDEVEEHFSVIWWPALVAVITVAVILGTGLLVYRYSQRRANDARASSAAVNTQGRQAVALVGFRNVSNRPEDAWLSTAVTEMLASEMSAGDKLRVIPNEEVAHAQADMGLNAGSADAGTMRTGLQQATGADMLVQGSYVVVNHGATPALRLMVQVEDAHSGKQVASFSETGELGTLFALVDQAGVELRKDLSDHISTQDDEQALASMSQSTDAMRFYAEGVDQERHFDAHGARNLFERAVQADPTFAMAHLGLAEAWSDLGFEERATKESAEAYKLSAKLPKPQRLAIEADYRNRSNDAEQAISIYRALSTFYPDDEKWGIKLASTQLFSGQMKEAVATLEGLRKLPLTPAQMVELDAYEAAAASHIDDARSNDQARSLLHEAVAIADKQGGLLLHGRAYRAQCFVLSHIGPVAAGRVACEQSKSTFQAIGNLLGVAAATNNLGVISQQAGQWEEAEAEYQDAGRQYHEIGNFELETDEIQNLAHLALSHGDLAKAIEGSRQLSRVTGTSDDYHTAYTGHRYTAIALSFSGKLQEAQAEAIASQLAAEKERASDNKVYHEARARGLRGSIAFEAGNLDEAQRLANEALMMVKPMHDQLGEALFTIDQAAIALEQGHVTREIANDVRNSAAVLSKLQDYSDDYIEAEVLLAQVEARMGENAEATRALAEARNDDSKGDSMDTHLDFLLGAADAQRALGNSEAAKKTLQEEVSIANAKGYAYLGLRGEIALARFDVNTAHLQVLGNKAEHAGFKGLARLARS